MVIPLLSVRQSRYVPEEELLVAGCRLQVAGEALLMKSSGLQIEGSPRPRPSLMIILVEGLVMSK